MKNPNRSALGVVVGIVATIWLAYLSIEYPPFYPSIWQDFVAPAILIVSGANVASFAFDWHKGVRAGFDDLPLDARFDFIQIEKIGPIVVIALLAINFVVGLMQIYLGTNFPKVFVGVPFALYLAGRYSFTLNIPKEKVLRTIKEGVKRLKDLSPRNQSTAMSLLRDEINKRLHSFAPLMNVSLNPILDAMYYIAFRGTPEQKEDTTKFLNALEDDLLHSDNPQSMLGHVSACKLADGAMPTEMKIVFNWERRTDWRKRFATISQIVLGIFSILGALATLKLI